jgi:hypothetical protein
MKTATKKNTKTTKIIFYEKVIHPFIKNIKIYNERKTYI